MEHADLVKRYHVVFNKNTSAQLKYLNSKIRALKACGIISTLIVEIRRGMQSNFYNDALNDFVPKHLANLEVLRIMVDPSLKNFDRIPSTDYLKEKGLTRETWFYIENDKELQESKEYMRKLEQLEDRIMSAIKLLNEISKGNVKDHIDDLFNLMNTMYQEVSRI